MGIPGERDAFAVRWQRPPEGGGGPRLEGMETCRVLSGQEGPSPAVTRDVAMVTPRRWGSHRQQRLTHLSLGGELQRTHLQGTMAQAVGCLQWPVKVKVRRWLPRGLAICTLHKHPLRADLA